MTVHTDAHAVLADLAQEFNAGKDKWESLEWRLDNLYWVVDKTGRECRFVMNDQQRDFIRRIWYRNLILKARQLGFSTLIEVLQLDQALFNPNHTGVVIADTLPNAGTLFKKVEFAYEHLSPVLREFFELQAKNAGSSIAFQHRDAAGTPQPSTIRVGVTSRGGTVNLLHVSEMGRIALKFPQRAEEIMTGAIPSVPPDGIAIIESTAQGAFGPFYDLCEPAMKRRESAKPETKLDWRLHFYPWFEAKEYRLSAEDTAQVEVPPDLRKYFAKLEAELHITIDADQRAWYVKTAETQKKKMKQEYPSCIAGHEPAFSPAGITRMDGIPVDGTVVRAFFDKGEREVFRLTTDLGYEVTCTADHPIKTPAGFVPLGELRAGGLVLIGAACEATGEPRAVQYNGPVPFVRSTIEIDEDFALFLGFYMGDGSFHEGTLSIACDADDADVVVLVRNLVERFVGDPSIRVTGTKGGCAEIRVSRAALASPFDALGLLRRNSGGGLMRRVHVPGYIKTSTLPVARAFLRGLFEADGFAQRDGTGVKFFTKYADFARDVQLMLLRFGVTCRRTTVNKIAGNGNQYEGHELSLRTNEAALFSECIGFVGFRKQTRAALRKDVAAGYENKRLPIATTATITTIEPAGRARVYDITTASHEFSAGGIIVHNCPKEAFEQAIEGAIYGDEMTYLREQGRITHTVGLDPNHPVDTVWDFGASQDKSGGAGGNGTNAIWFHQKVGLQHRWFWYVGGFGKGLRFWWIEVCEAHRQRHGYRWGQHFLPHDADAEILGEVVTTKHRILNELGMRNEVVVPRIANLDTGHELVAKGIVTNHWFHAANADWENGDDLGAGLGVKGLDGYQHEWDDKRGIWSPKPLHNWASHPADAIRQYFQAEANGMVNLSREEKSANTDEYEERRNYRRRRNWKTA